MGEKLLSAPFLEGACVMALVAHAVGRIIMLRISYGMKQKSRQ